MLNSLLFYQQVVAAVLKSRHVPQPFWCFLDFLFEVSVYDQNKELLDF